jgi:triosephosphate isomerase (TIM)
MQKLIVGNWKMNGMSNDLSTIADIAKCAAQYTQVRSGLCIPVTILAPAVSANPEFMLGGQDCHMKASGAHTGCISAAMLADVGAKSVIVGHSERRADQGETDADVQAKALAALAVGLTPIICVGETLNQRDTGEALSVVLGQIDCSLPEEISDCEIVVAYEPVWAIGTGRVPSNEDVAAMHEAIRLRLIEKYGKTGVTISILYGGSMNGENAASLLSIDNVDGGLIGGASLSRAKFEPILDAANN